MPEAEKASGKFIEAGKDTTVMLNLVDKTLHQMSFTVPPLIIRAIRLAIGEEIQLVISEDVVTETKRNLSRKAPEIIPVFESLVSVIDMETVPSLSREAIAKAEEYVAQKDAFIIAAAIMASVDYVATFDRKHLIDPPQVRELSGLNIDTPANILNQIRSSRSGD